jgi:hypothetical protein
MVVVECFSPSGDAGNSGYEVYSRAAVLEFHAAAGHVYEVLSYDSGSELGFSHLEVHDQSSDESFVIRAPLVRVQSLFRQVSTVPQGWATNRALLVRSGCRVKSVVGVAKDQWPILSSSQLQDAITLETNAYVFQGALSLALGTVTIAVKCWRYKTKEVSFDAKAARLYRIDLQDQGHSCIRILDVTDQVFEVMCVPVTTGDYDH